MAEFEDEGEERGEEEGLPEFLRHQRDSSGDARLDLRLQGIADLENVNVDGIGRWDQIGPAPLIIDADQVNQGIGPDAGVVGDIAIDPGGANDETIYVAFSYGGVWRTTDGGATWVATMDGLPSLSMGALALDPSDPQTLYAGVGSLLNLRSQRIKFAGAGLFKSIDGGSTWFLADGGRNATSFERLDVNRVVCPQANMVFAGTSGGLFCSVDGGLNFGSNHPAYNDGQAIIFPVQHGVRDASVTALTLDTTAPGTNIWVALSGFGVFGIAIAADKSLAVGPNLFANAGAPTPGLYGDVLFVQGRGNTGAPRPDQTFYTSVQFTNAANVASFVGLFKSTDAGAHWANVASTTPSPIGLAARLGAAGANQSDYDFTLGVDPQDANRIYAGFKELWRSADAANTFPEATASSDHRIHLDQHALVFSPPTHWAGAPAPTRVYAGTDGGLARSTDGGTSWNSINLGIATNLFYGIDIGRGSAANNAFTYGGCQDTGIEGHRGGDIAGQWHTGLNGDGGHVAVDPVNPQIVYGFSNEFFAKSADGGGSWDRSETVKTLNITGATNANPVVITSTAHGLQSGHLVLIGGVLGNTAANGLWIVTRINANTFSIPATGNAAYTSGGNAKLLSRADRTITGASNSAPIAITAVGHPYRTGDSVTISGVGGNTAANGSFVITRVDNDHFTLNGTTGNGAYTSGGVARGPGIGRGLMSPAGEFTLRRVAVVPNGALPAATVFVSEVDKLYRSDDGGLTFTAVTTILPGGSGDRTIGAITCVDATHLWVGLLNGSVHFSNDNGLHWDPAGFTANTGSNLEVAAIAVDPANLNRVAVAHAAYSEINPKFSTRHCFISTNNGQSWQDASGTDGNPAGNLPDLPLHDVVFDASVVPSALVVATDGAVLRSTDSGAHWSIMGVDLPRASCQSLAIDNAAAPRLLRVGTYGRSAFEFARPATPAIVVRGHLAFGPVRTGQTRTLLVTVYNTGNAALSITNFHRVSGSTDFTLPGAPAFPVAVPPGGSQNFNVAFAPGAGGNLVAGFTIENNDPGIAIFPLLASGQGVAAAGTARLAVRANLRFGDTQGGQTRSLPIEISNTGLNTLTVTGFSRTSGSDDFKLNPAPALPISLAPGASQTINVDFSPTSNGAISAEFTIDSNDPRQAHRVVPAKGVGVAAGSNTLLIILIILGILLAGGLVAAGIYAATKK